MKSTSGSGFGSGSVSGSNLHSFLAGFNLAFEPFRDFMPLLLLGLLDLSTLEAPGDFISLIISMSLSSESNGLHSFFAEDLAQNCCNVLCGLPFDASANFSFLLLAGVA